MRILILCKKFPWPLREGEPFATWNLARSLHEAGCEISLLVMNTTKHPFNVRRIPEECSFFREIRSVEVDNRITIGGAIKNLLSGHSYILSRFYSREYESALQNWLEQENFDIVQMETVFMALYLPMIRRYSRACAVMRAHNVEHQIWERYGKECKNLLKRFYIGLQNTGLKKFEIEMLAEYDLLVAITNVDLEKFRRLGFRGPGIAAPAAIDPAAYKGDFSCFHFPVRLAFIGALDWMPNQAGIMWFLRNVWTELKRRFPELELHVAGKNTPAFMQKLEIEGVFFHGEVPDATDFINQFPVFIIPLFSTSGIRIKILETLALGRLVVTTSKGMEGIPAIHRKHLLVADNAQEFIDEISWLLEHPSKWKAICTEGMQLVSQEFDRTMIANQLYHTYQRVCGRGI